MLIVISPWSIYTYVRKLYENSNVHAVCYRHPVSKNQLFHPMHSSFCRNLNKVTRSGIICDFRTSFREFLHPAVNRFTRQTLPTMNREKLFMNILCIESSCPQKRRTTERSSSIVYSKYSRHFDYRNQLLNKRMRACYLDCHEAGLCCNVVIYTETLLRPL
jgi:hypothetical protein